METTLGNTAHNLLSRAYGELVRQESAVLKDVDPEPLHKMRVQGRKLRTALGLFHPGLCLPKIVNERTVRDLGRVLGRLRDLDVQWAALRNYPEELALLQNVRRQRRAAFTMVTQTLTGRRYQKFKAAFSQWLKTPQFLPVAQRPLVPLLPYLCVPKVAALIVHPGWLCADGRDPGLLHDLRKTLKQVRYQSEFFTNYYPPRLGRWIENIKVLQDTLGNFQDMSVWSLQLKPTTAALQSLIETRKTEALGQWQQLRLSYLDPDFLAQLYQLQTPT